jgi:hypothetical protein
MKLLHLCVILILGFSLFACTTFDIVKAQENFQFVLIGQIVPNEQQVSIISTPEGDRITMIHVRIIRELREIKSVRISDDLPVYHISNSIKEAGTFKFDDVSLQPMRNGLVPGDIIVLFLEQDLQLPLQENITIKFEL